MSWCRLSTNINNECSSDLYIFDSVGDFIAVYVAGRRRKNYKDNPYPEKTSLEYDRTNPDWTQQFLEDGNKRRQWFQENEEWELLPEEYAGKMYEFPYTEMDSLEEFLIKAREDGINFPDYIFDYVKEYEREYQVVPEGKV